MQICPTPHSSFPTPPSSKALKIKPLLNLTSALMRRFSWKSHPFRLLLYLEWILLGIAVLMVFSPHPPMHPPPPHPPFDAPPPLFPTPSPHRQPLPYRLTNRFRLPSLRC
ncbi:hypothetical protein K9N68_25840 [Kovacikia minuta CCNUW1]|uniref:hypothetical protein n=1 Tax=Kovacikia minuta TaxID=2931930 RepID=UPI001CCED12E|nr:hypothetical protein [Kovacikia minuta]UBF25030.1 hypothetical protein K9N68_25840 [Kovacikia minuta CCNUW1]